jgi:hypothetical protein
MGIAQVGAQAHLNFLAGLTVPIVGGSAPTWVPGLSWVDPLGVPQTWNGTAWVPDTGSRYVALLSADPGSDTTIAALTEIITPGYARFLISMAPATAARPSVTESLSTIIWGPMTADMALAAGWAALVTVATGVLGQVLFTWKLPKSQKVATSQSVVVATNDLQLSE